MDKDKSLKEIASLLGSKGGASTRDKYGSGYFRELQKKGVEARKANKAKREQEEKGI